MKIIEFGKQNQGVIIFLHGGGLSWWNYKEEAERLREKYHVVIPILDGHGDSDRNFVSIEENAKAICQYIKEHFSGKVLAIAGLSLGGQILVEMLSQSPDICQYALIESTLVVPMPFTNRLIRPMFGMSYGLVKKRWFAKMQFKELRIKKELFEEYYQDTCKISKENMIAFLLCNSSYLLKDSLGNTSAKAVIAVGSREQKNMRESAQILHRKIRESELFVLKDYYHGDLSLNHADEYLEILNNLLKR